MNQFSIEEKAIWWKQQIRAKRKTETDMIEWLDREAPSWELGDRARFKIAFEGKKFPWDKWITKAK